MVGRSAKHQDLVDQHVEAQHCKPEGHGLPHHACQLGHLEREERTGFPKEIDTTLLHSKDHSGRGQALDLGGSEAFEQHHAARVAVYVFSPLTGYVVEPVFVS